MLPTNSLFMFTSFNCRRMAPLLWALPDQLSARDAARLNAHLASCSACRKEAAELKTVGQLLRQNAPTPLAPSADLWSRIETEIAPQSPAPAAPEYPGRMHRAKPFVPALGGMAWAGSVAIVAIGGAWMAYGGGFLHRPHAAPAATGASTGIAANNAAADALDVPSPFASVRLLPSPAVGAAPRVASVQKAKAAKNAASPKARPAAPTIAAVHTRRANVAPRQMARADADRPREEIFQPSQPSLRVTHAVTAKLTQPVTAPVFAAAPSIPPAPTAAPFEAVQIAAVAPAPRATDEDIAAANRPEPANPVFEGDAPPAPSVFVSAKPAGVFYAYAAADAGATATTFTSDTETTISAPTARRRRPVSVADAAVQTQRQQALFSYGRP